MGTFVTIITVAFFPHWICSLISMQYCSSVGACMDRNDGVYAVQSFLSAEGRVSQYC